MAPNYTAGAMCLIERDDGALLLVRQVYRDRWGAPGGLMNRRETPEDAARREVLEEVGVRVELIGEPAVVVEEKLQRIDIVYRARLVDPSDQPRATSAEIGEVRWHPREALPELQSELTKALVAMARISNVPMLSPAQGSGSSAGSGTVGR